MPEREREKSARDRNLLFGVAAVHLNLVKPRDLARASEAWSLESGDDLGDALVRLGFLECGEKVRVEEFVAGRISAGGSVTASLASFGGASAVHQCFGGHLTWDGPLPEPRGSGEGARTEGSAEGREDFCARLDDPDCLSLEYTGRYRVKGELARGGIGKVFIAYDQHIGREVALKELLPELCPRTLDPASAPSPSPGPLGSKVMTRFLREARITGRLNHPAIVPVYEIARKPDGNIYYTMRLVQGKTLAQHLEERPTLSERLQLLPNYLDLCQAMAYAHSKGVIHRDLKPSNIILGEYGETVVLDWGLAKARGVEDISTEGETSRSGGFGRSDLSTQGPIGTPLYMSPEQAAGTVGEIDERSDVWALGAILYYILAGRPPFKAEDAYAVMGRILTEPVVPVGELILEAPAELCEIAMRCLAKDKGRRFADAGEVSERVSEVVLVLLGPMSFLQVRKERNEAIEARRQAERERAATQAKEEEARRNLAEAYFQYGRLAEKDARFNDARVHFAKCLSLSGREDARSALYWEATQPIQVALHRTLSGHLERVTATRFSPDGERLVSASWDETLKLWSVRTGECLRTFHGNEDWVTSVAFSPDGAYLAAGSAESVNLWSVETGECIFRLSGHESQVMGVAYSPDGELAASGAADHTIRLWKVSTGDQLRIFSGHQDWVVAIDFSPDQKSLISGSWDRTVKLWDLESGECRRTFAGHDEEVTSVQFDLDCQTALSASYDRTLKLWDLATGQALKTCRGHDDRIYSAAFHALGNLAVSGSDDKSIRLWDLDRNECLRSFVGHEIRVSSVGFSPDGNYMASGSWDKTIKLWSVMKRDSVQVLVGHDSDVAAVAVSPDGRLIASGGLDTTIMIWSLASGEPLRTLVGHEGPVATVAFSPDSTRLVSGSWDHTLKLWDPRTGEDLGSFTGHTDEVLSAGFTPDGRTIISESYDATIRTWCVADRRCERVIAGHQHPIFAGAISPDGTALVSGSCAEMAGFDCARGEMKLWGLPGVELLATITGHNDNVLCAAFAPDGRSLASGSLESIKLWDRETGTVIATLTGHRHWVKSVDFSPDGNYLVSGGDDRDVKIWSRRTNQCLLTLTGHRDGVNQVCFAPDGRRIVSAGKDGTVRVWPVIEGLLTADNETILAQAQAETGLELDGFNLVQARPAGREIG